MSVLGDYDSWVYFQILLMLNPGVINIWLGFETALLQWIQIQRHLAKLVI